MADTTKKRRRRGRPLKEESNAIQLEKNILDMKESFIAMVPEAHKVLRELMLDSKTKQNIRQSIAEYVLNKAEKMQEEYDDMFDEGEEEVPVAEAKPAPFLPFTTEIQPVSKS
ncbi:hypothetical protein BAU67_001822 [Escherichia coli]|nr:hypothetical protein [Escherichia coli]EMB7054266.1 hypothetical protein [Escherichia coli]